MCHHVANIIIPTKNVDNWEVLSFHATSTAGEVGALLVATTTGFLSNDHFKCTDVNPTSLGKIYKRKEKSERERIWKNTL